MLIKQTTHALLVNDVANCPNLVAKASKFIAALASTHGMPFMYSA